MHVYDAGMISYLHIQYMRSFQKPPCANKMCTPVKVMLFSVTMALLLAVTQRKMFRHNHMKLQRITIRSTMYCVKDEKEVTPSKGGCC